MARCVRRNRVSPRTLASATQTWLDVDVRAESGHERAGFVPASQAWQYIVEMIETMSAVPVWVVALVLAAAAPFLVRVTERGLQERIRRRTRLILAKSVLTKSEGIAGMERAIPDRQEER
jgi:hypothetical protein